MSQVIVTTGMGRSGTSLVSSLLQSAGVHIGDVLLTPYPDNPRGYFEDIDFYEFHECLLHERKKSYLYVDASFSFQPTSTELERARQLLAKRSNRALWGWKDPRTALFLPFWHQLLPQARFLFVYRHPLEVLLSLLRRGEFDNHPYLAAGLQAWQIYNGNIKAFYDQRPEQCLLVHIEGVVGQVEQFADLLQHKLGLNLRLDAHKFHQIYHCEELQKTPLCPEVTDVVAKLCPGLLELYHRLNAQADVPPNASHSDAAPSPPLSALAEFTATLPEPINLPVKHSLLQLLVSLLTPQPTETMLSRFYQNAKGAQQTIDHHWRKVQRLERTNIEQREMLQIQQAQLEAQQAELRQVYETPAWKLIRSYSRFKERWQKKAA